MIHLQVINQLYLLSSHVNSICLLFGDFCFCLFFPFYFKLLSFTSGRAQAGKGITRPWETAVLYWRVPRAENVWLQLDVTPLVLAQYNNLSVTVWNYRKTMCKSKFSCKLTLTLIKNNFKIMTSAKLLFCRHLLTPANIKYRTDVGERGLTPSPPPTEILSFCRKTYTLSLHCKLITFISSLNVWFC